MVPVMRPPLKTPQSVLSVLGLSKVPVALTPFWLTSETEVPLCVMWQTAPGLPFAYHRPLAGSAPGTLF